MPKPVNLEDIKITTCLSCTLPECNQASIHCAFRLNSPLSHAYHNSKKRSKTDKGRISSRKSSKKFTPNNPNYRKNCLKTDVCLTCELSDCDDNNPKCAFNKIKCKAQRDYYHRMKLDPEFRLKRNEAKKRWRKTESGKKSNAESVSRYRKKNPEIISKIQKRYDENHKEQRRAWVRMLRSKSTDVIIT